MGIKIMYMEDLGTLLSKRENIYFKMNNLDVFNAYFHYERESWLQSDNTIYLFN